MKLYSRQDPVLSLWLTTMCVAIVLMVFIGGLTRLTDSGLSMTDWRPITGFIPPLNESDWQKEFSKYQNSPEFKKINKGMNLAEFKSIYWLEFIHRVAGRITAILFLAPLIIFIISGRISGADILIYLGIGCLIGLQGVMGWYMVKSGLIDNPHVSHYRLAAHLILAMIIYSLLFWQKMRQSFEIMLVSNKSILKNCRILLFLTLGLTFLQTIFGALVAGLDAGLIYNTYPLMGDSFVPTELKDYKFSFNAFNDHVFVQFIHRVTAIILFVVTCITCMSCVTTDVPKLKQVASFILFAITLQVSLGIITLIYVVPISYALSHQIGAMFLLSCLLWGLFLIKNT